MERQLVLEISIAKQLVQRQKCLLGGPRAVLSQNIFQTLPQRQFGQHACESVHVKAHLEALSRLASRIWGPVDVFQPLSARTYMYSAPVQSGDHPQINTQSTCKRARLSVGGVKITKTCERMSQGNRISLRSTDDSYKTKCKQSNSNPIPIECLFQLTTLLRRRAGSPGTQRSPCSTTANSAGKHG
jgi:hypothetical protein